MNDRVLSPAHSVADPHLMVAFDTLMVPRWLESRLGDSPPAGVSLFREWNLENPNQTAELTSTLQKLNSGPHPLLVAVDQEGGQLLGLKGSTPFAGNMAVGAVGDSDLAYRVAYAMGSELAAVGINVNYAPAVDIATQPSNPSLGIRSFGDVAQAVADLGAATVRGFEAAGVRSSVKHYPGKGEAVVDPHYELPVLNLSRERLDGVELVPFREALSAGARIVMVGHYVVPALTGSNDLPISVSVPGIEGSLRGEMDFDGLVITDALDMGALDQGESQVVEVIAMMRAGVDLLLCMPDLALQQRVRMAVELGVSRGLIADATLNDSKSRIERIRSELTIVEPDPSVVANGEHARLAEELAARSVTLVRNDAQMLPLEASNQQQILVLEPEPSDVTPADTTSRYPPLMAAALGRFHPNVVELIYPQRPQRSDVAGAVSMAAESDLIIIGTVVVGDEQAALVRALQSTRIPVVTVALRTPFDLAAYPSSQTHICTYSSHGPSMSALASAIFGKQPFRGRLPAAIPGLFKAGHGLISDANT